MNPHLDHGGARSNVATHPTLERAVRREIGPRYRLLAPLGHGSSASVWYVEDLTSGERLAAKRLVGSEDEGGAFHRELAALMCLDHPRFTRVRDLLECEGARYLFVEHCRGGSLREHLDALSGVRPSLDAIRRTGSAIAEALAVAHRRGLLHGDVKPENVLFLEPFREPLAGYAKLADLGLARGTRSPGDESGDVDGTPLYLAPERLGGHATPAADVYALGVVLYEMSHGRAPFEGSVQEILRGHMHREPEVDPSLPESWAELLLEMLAKDPTDRPGAPDVLARLARVHLPELLAPTASRCLGRRGHAIAARIDPVRDLPVVVATTAAGAVQLTGAVDARWESLPSVAADARLVAAGHRLLVAQHRSVSALEGGSADPVLTAPALIRALDTASSHDRTKLVLLCGDVLLRYELGAVATLEAVQPAPRDSSDVALSADGRVLLARQGTAASGDGLGRAPGGGRLDILSPGRADAETVWLPGPCRRVVVCGRAEAFAEVGIGGGRVLVHVDLDKRSWRYLASEPRAVAVDERSDPPAVHVFTSDQRLSTFTRGGRLTASASLPPGEVVDASAAHGWLAALVHENGTSFVRMWRTEPRAEPRSGESNPESRRKERKHV